jgi:hypothetical protein
VRASGPAEISLARYRELLAESIAGNVAPAEIKARVLGPIRIGRSTSVSDRFGWVAWTAKEAHKETSLWPFRMRGKVV